MNIKVTSRKTRRTIATRFTCDAEENDLTPVGITFEVYRNEPGKKQPEKLKTDVYMKLAEA